MSEDKIVLGNCICDFVRLEKEAAEELDKAERRCFGTEAWSRRMFEEAMENPACRTYGLYNRQMNNIIAYSVLYVCEDECDLANIAVLPEWRRQGIGGAFLDKCLEKARENGAERIFLEVRESNTAARRLYGSRGFAKIGKRRNYYREPREDAVLMMREKQ